MTQLSSRGGMALVGHTNTRVPARAFGRLDRAVRGGGRSQGHVLPDRVLP